MDPSWVQVGVAVLTMVLSAGYTVSRVDKTTAVLSERLRALKEVFDRLLDRADGLERRVSTLEARLGVDRE